MVLSRCVVVLVVWCVMWTIGLPVVSATSAEAAAKSATAAFVPLSSSSSSSSSTRTIVSVRKEERATSFSSCVRSLPSGTKSSTTTTSSLTMMMMMATTTDATTATVKNRYDKVFVAGASRGVGRAIVDKLSSEGGGRRQVVALVRDEQAANDLNNLEGVTAVVGDAFDYKTVEGAMDGCNAAITTLGGSVQDDGKRVDYDGNSNVIEAAGILGVTRVVLLTSIGCGDSKDAPPPAVYETLKEVLAAKERAENVLIKYYTNMNWTIIRPGGLKSEPATGEAILSEDKMAIGSIHRQDLANLVVQALESDKTERKVLSAVDPSITSAANVDGRVVDAFALA